LKAARGHFQASDFRVATRFATPSIACRARQNLGARRPRRRNILPLPTFRRFRRNVRMNSIIYLVGLIVVVLAILSFVGLR
jgi:hypothetical protein